MSDYIFGKTITRTFTPVENDVYFNLVSQAPSIYLYSATSLPTMQNMINGVGAFDHITYWQESAESPYTKTYTVNPIVDPDPTSTTTNLGYWEVVNYVAKAAGATQSRSRYFTVGRALALDSTPTTSTQDLKDIYPAISGYADDAELQQHLINAEEEVRLELKGMGYEWGKIKGLKNIRLALAYKTIQFLAESQIVVDSDKFTIRRTIYMDKYDKLMKLLRLDYDSDGDGQAESSVSSSPDFQIFAK